MPVQQGIMSAYQLGAHTHQGVAQGGVLDRYGLTHANLEAIAAVLSDHNKAAHDALAINADQVDGVEGAEILQRDGSVPLTGAWNAGTEAIRNIHFWAGGGGNIVIGAVADMLRLIYDTDEIAKILGVSNAIAGIKISKAIIGAFELNSLIADNKVPDSDKVDGIEGAEILQRDGSVPLTAQWLADQIIRVTNLWVSAGGNFLLGELANNLRIVKDTNETLKIIGQSDAIGGIKISKAIVGAFELNSLIANNKVPDADTVDGEHAAAITTNARVKAHFPDTIANILSNHTKAVHDALKIESGYLGAPTELTINAGAITVIKNYHTVDGEGDAADDLNTINGGVEGMFVMLGCEAGGRAITVKHNVDNIRVQGDADMLLNLITKKALCFYDATSSIWLVIPFYG